MSIGSFDCNLAIADDARDSGTCLRIHDRLVVVHLFDHTLHGLFAEIGKDCKGLGTPCFKETDKTPNQRI